MTAPPPARPLPLVVGPDLEIGPGRVQLGLTRCGRRDVANASRPDLGVAATVDGWRTRDGHR